jgi:hypothetical protein
MALEGDVETFPLDDLFGWLARRRASGVVTLARGMTIRRFHLRAGKIRMVSSSEQEMLLGHLLVERKLLGPEALAEALAGRGRSRARLGRLLLRGGLVTPAQLQQILAEKVRRLLADALTWSEGRFIYETEGKPRRRELAVAVDLGKLLEQIQRGAVDDCLVIDDDDVIEALPAPADERPG